MENKLKKLFDFQRFEQNEKLGKLIQETESLYANELSDDDLFLVNAAGEITSYDCTPDAKPQLPDGIFGDEKSESGDLSKTSTGKKML